LSWSNPITCTISPSGSSETGKAYFNDKDATWTCSNIPANMSAFSSIAVSLPKSYHAAVDAHTLLDAIQRDNGENNYIIATCNGIGLVSYKNDIEVRAKPLSLLTDKDNVLLSSVKVELPSLVDYYTSLSRVLIDGRSHAIPEINNLDLTKNIINKTVKFKGANTSSNSIFTDPIVITNKEIETYMKKLSIAKLKITANRYYSGYDIKYFNSEDKVVNVGDTFGRQSYPGNVLNDIEIQLPRISALIPSNSSVSTLDRNTIVKIYNNSSKYINWEASGNYTQYISSPFFNTSGGEILLFDTSKSGTQTLMLSCSAWSKNDQTNQFIIKQYMPDGTSITQKTIYLFSGDYLYFDIKKREIYTQYNYKGQFLTNSEYNASFFTIEVL
jgi:hypothetical protein